MSLANLLIGVMHLTHGVVDSFQSKHNKVVSRGCEPFSEFNFCSVYYGF